MTDDDLLALGQSFEGTSLQPHFDKQSVRVGKRIFLTCGGGDLPVIKLSPLLQEAVIANHPQAAYAIENYWGRQGWTRIDPKQLSQEQLSDLIDLAWRQVAPKRMLKGGNIDRS